jgi:hypothetical protein
MVSKAEHARRTIGKLEAKLSGAKDPHTRQEMEASLARWRQYLLDLGSTSLEAADRSKVVVRLGSPFTTPRTRPS